MFSRATDACGNFAKHLVWHKPRPIVPGQKIEALADDHSRKVACCGLAPALSWKSFGIQTTLHRSLEDLSRAGDDLLLARPLAKLSRVHSYMRPDLNGREHIKQMFNIQILWHGPSPIRYAEETQNLSSVFFLRAIVGNNRLISFSSTPQATVEVGLEDGGRSEWGK